MRVTIQYGDDTLSHVPVDCDVRYRCLIVGISRMTVRTNFRAVAFRLKLLHYLMD